MADEGREQVQRDAHAETTSGPEATSSIRWDRMPRGRFHPERDDSFAWNRYGCDEELMWGWVDDRGPGTHLLARMWWDDGPGMDESGSVWWWGKGAGEAHRNVVCLGWDAERSERLVAGERVNWDDIWARDHRIVYPDPGPYHAGMPLRAAPAGAPSRYPPDALVEDASLGIVEDLVGAIAPHSEADPMALIIQFLAAVGNIVGRRAYFQAERDRHYPNLFAVLVGETAKGRKGTSWGQAVRVFEGLEARVPDVGVWLKHHISSGLSSGEGLIHILRDAEPDDQEPQEQAPAGKPRKKGTAGSNSVGASTPLTELQRDKRLLVRESEFASVLKMFLREGNTLSAVLRQAWDGDPLAVITKQSSERASNTHVSVVGHITRDELVRALTQTEAANGLGNRFLWMCVRRSKLLPDGGDLDAVNLSPQRTWLAWVLEWIAGLRDVRLTRDDEASELWHEVYRALSDGEPGLVGALTARAEAQVMRLASIYALLHHSTQIDVQCLNAALAVWEYARQSAHYIFGDAHGDPTVDTILKALRQAPAGMTRTELLALFGRNLPAAQLERALTSLEEHALVFSQWEETGGRPAQRWYANGPARPE